MTYPPPPGQPGEPQPYQPQPYQQYPAQPAYGAPPTPPAPARLRGHKPRRLGWIFLALGIVLIIVGSVLYDTQALSKVDGFSRVPIAAGTGSATFKGTGGYVAYYEATGANSKTKNIPIILIRLTSPSGKQMILDTLYGGSSRDSLKIKSDLSYSHNGHDGIAVYQFKITETGTYKVEFAGTSVAAANSDMAFGRSIGTGTAIAAALIVPGVLLLIAAIVLLIIGFVKKRRHRRDLAAYSAPGMPPPPPGSGYPPPYPPAGYQPPPSYEPGPPQP